MNDYIAKNAFVCWRPYQVFNAINMVINDVEGTTGKSDIYLLNTPSLIKLQAGLLESKLFLNVLFFYEDDYESSVKNKLSRFQAYLLPKKFLLSHVIENRQLTFKYEKIFASGWMPFFVCMAGLNRTSNIIMFEDGLATYIGSDNRQKNSTLMYKIFYAITKKGKASFAISKLYAYKPNLIENPITNNIGLLPSIDERSFPIISPIFNYKKVDNYSSKQLVYLDQPYEDDKNVNYKLKYYIFNYLEQIGLDFIIRLHPVQKEIEGNYSIDEENQNWVH